MADLAANDPRYKRIAVAAAINLNWITPVDYLAAFPGAFSHLKYVAAKQGDDRVMQEVNFRRDLLASFYGFADNRLEEMELFRKREKRKEQKKR